MQGIFYDCPQLKYIDLSNFNTSSVTNMIGIVNYCTNLIYVNLYNFAIKEGIRYDRIFDNTSSYLQICINDSYTISQLKSIYTNIFQCYQNNIDNQQDLLIKNLENYFTSEIYNTTHLLEGEDEFFEDEKIKVTLTTVKNQNKNQDKNITTIDLGQCEDLLREKYNISKNESIYSIIY